ncbi:hypothetical protein NC651_007879 [Populus alba x Populus x berolinensis]|nr:hypothetical protein NC651_007879 [Populus alba x Populus x berolinensis]
MPSLTFKPTHMSLRQQLLTRENISFLASIDEALKCTWNQQLRLHEHHPFSHRYI